MLTLIESIVESRFKSCKWEDLENIELILTLSEEIGQLLIIFDHFNVLRFRQNFATFLLNFRYQYFEKYQFPRTL